MPVAGVFLAEILAFLPLLPFILRPRFEVNFGSKSSNA
jgi:hypothetical protein